MIRVIAIAALALSLGGCTLDQFYQVESDALAVVAKIKAGYAIAAVEVDAAIGKVCMSVPAVNSTIQQVTGALPNPGPKTRVAIRTGNDAVIGAQAACDAYNTALPGERKSLLLQIWRGYQAGKAAAVAANAAGGA